MGQSLDTQDKRSRNVELNIVPFIDLMSCLTAFLLITAVWVNMSSLENDAAVRGKSDSSTSEPPTLAILIEHDGILVASRPGGEARQLGAFDWPSLEATLREYATASELPHVEIAAASSHTHPIAYQHLIAAMDVAVKAGLPRVGVTDPNSLAR